MEINTVIILLGLIFLWLVFLSFFLIKTARHYRYLISKVKKGDLKVILEEILRRVDKQGKDLESLGERLTKEEKKALKSLQQVGFVRFNPFSDTGGDQSFCLSLLDGEDNGIVLSSLHSRGQTRVYGKAVAKAKGKEAPLSKEEEETIKKAKKGK
ncbi:hypothetical protein COT75_03730 [Candidatus Beckwithbacteria bacterium CG10_big_fil_rev_8_21_14_0_10_34_10]|uniref:DUF4446 domain-containing protein n=1 Tax=Candidatus Beckwithbacteria bacterium CG10_big_fil_rev_8_21_14_0_10_34_10 TaxID=1974495 RepID=A0A2H0W8I3_9BACT|nr:MAG: hypothetical protein COT75_03730 [Candidatus Beckwithbacteria bacterium CG10_big_fil_rev_8_21_14_0_10_34_10]